MIIDEQSQGGALRLLVGQVGIAEARAGFIPCRGAQDLTTELVDAGGDKEHGVTEIDVRGALRSGAPMGYDGGVTAFLDGYLVGLVGMLVAGAVLATVVIVRSR